MLELFWGIPQLRGAPQVIHCFGINLSTVRTEALSVITSHRRCRFRGPSVCFRIAVR